jgi:predicted phosphodiesterase
MRLAIVSDIHGNYEALEEVLADIEQSQVDRIISLGDNIGYGPDPEGVLRALDSLNVPSVLGNHEMAIVEPSFLNWFNPSARESLAITRRLLSRESLDWIRGFGRSLDSGSGLFVHGFPPDSVTRYLFEVSNSEFESLFDSMIQQVCFVGHTHELVMVEYAKTQVEQRNLICGTYFLEDGGKYVINAGSVGQPRDGDRRAKYVVWDQEERTLDVRCLAYDVAKTVKKIMDLGFPQINARRLL